MKEKCYICKEEKEDLVEVYGKKVCSHHKGVEKYLKAMQLKHLQIVYNKEFGFGVHKFEPDGNISKVRWFKREYERESEESYIPVTDIEIVEEGVEVRDKDTPEVIKAKREYESYMFAGVPPHFFDNLSDADLITILKSPGNLLSFLHLAISLGRTFGTVKHVWRLGWNKKISEQEKTLLLFRHIKKIRMKNKLRYPGKGMFLPNC